MFVYTNINFFSYFFKIFSQVINICTIFELSIYVNFGYLKTNWLWKFNCIESLLSILKIVVGYFDVVSCIKLKFKNEK
jgi:hypothetical protein